MSRFLQSQKSSIKEMLYPDTSEWSKYIQSNYQTQFSKPTSSLSNPQGFNYYFSQKPSTCNHEQRNLSLNNSNNEENIYNILNDEKETMFDKYYSNQQKSKTSTNLFPQNNNNKEKDLESNSSKIEKLIKEYKEKFGSDEILENMIKNYYGKIKSISNEKKDEYTRRKTNKMKSKTLVLPKIKNHNHHNTNLTTENKIIIKHKNYGKIPFYIKKYEMESKLKKEDIKRKEEEAKYPKGTKLLSDDERTATLEGLLTNKKEISNLLEKMPITNRTISTMKKKEELIKKLEEIETAIQMFSKKRVFIKI